MFWQEETPLEQFQVPGEIVDVVFDINGKELPVDHVYALATALFIAVPWLKDDPYTGIHTIYVAGSQNGWERPEHSVNSRLMLSHRTKLTLRTRWEQAIVLQNALAGINLDVDGCALLIGNAKLKPLSKNTTLFARHVVIADKEDETVFLQWVAQELQNMDIILRKALCGKTVGLTAKDGILYTRSLLLADLSLEESIRIQQQGLGACRHLGCGIFIPHKGISAVKKIAS